MQHFIVLVLQDCIDGRHLICALRGISSGRCQPGNNLGFIAKMVWLHGACVLFSKNDVGAEGAKYLASFIPVMTQLRTLSLA
jgi:hypothetical protein